MNTTIDNIAHWEARLEREWPQRPQVAQHVAAQVTALGMPQPLVLELACGAGFGGGVLLHALPGARYVGVDNDAALLDAARARLATLNTEQHGAAQLHFGLFDLAATDWLAWLHQHAADALDAVVSLQAIHDIGDAAAQATLYRRVRETLRPGGLFAFADLLLNPAKPHPRRLPAAQHIALLHAAGFTEVLCTLRSGEFGCFAARA